MSRTRTRRQYSFAAALFDVIMTFLTGGLWLIWVFIRFARANS